MNGTTREDDPESTGYVGLIHAQRVRRVDVESAPGRFHKEEGLGLSRDRVYGNGTVWEVWYESDKPRPRCTAARLRTMESFWLSPEYAETATIRF